MYFPTSSENDLITNQGHAALQNIDELRQLVQARFAQEEPQTRKPRVVSLVMIQSFSLGRSGI